MPNEFESEPQWKPLLSEHDHTRTLSLGKSRKAYSKLVGLPFFWFGSAEYPAKHGLPCWILAFIAIGRCSAGQFGPSCQRRSNSGAWRDSIFANFHHDWQLGGHMLVIPPMEAVSHCKRPQNNLVDPISTLLLGVPIATLSSQAAISFAFASDAISINAHHELERIASILMKHPGLRCWQWQRRNRWFQIQSFPMGYEIDVLFFFDLLGLKRNKGLKS